MATFDTFGIHHSEAHRTLAEINASGCSVALPEIKMEANIWLLDNGAHLCTAQTSIGVAVHKTYLHLFMLTYGMSNIRIALCIVWEPKRQFVASLPFVLICALTDLLGSPNSAVCTPPLKTTPGRWRLSIRTHPNYHLASSYLPVSVKDGQAMLGIHRPPRVFPSKIAAEGRL